jgi:hypothetical protein
MIRMKSALASLLLLLATLTILTPPAHAGWPGGKVVHAGDDAGYNPPIFVRCDSGLTFSLGLGTSSWWSSSPNQQTCSDVDQIAVGAGDQIRCQTRYTFNWTTFDATGWHNVGNFTDFSGCYQQKD